MIVDLRSDTCSCPDEGMRKAMAEAPVGNESWGEDPSVNTLIRKFCELTGKEDGLFCCSGTMANLCSAMTHASFTGFGAEVMMDRYSHSNWYEVGNITTIAGMSLFPVENDGTYLSDENLQKALKPRNNHMTHSYLLWVENTYMLGGGEPIPLSEMQRLRAFADKNGMKIHLDGARLLNAAVAQNVSPEEIARYADSVQMCISKGLGAPFGSVLLGTKEFIEQARWCRVAIGGGLRQAGIMAAAGVYAVDHYKETFTEMHANAKRLANGLAALIPACIDMESVRTNMVLLDPTPLGMTTQEFSAMLLPYDVKVMAGVPSKYGTRVRMMTYPGITEKHIDKVIASVKDALKL